MSAMCKPTKMGMELANCFLRYMTVLKNSENISLQLHIVIMLLIMNKFKQICNKMHLKFTISCHELISKMI